MRLTKAAAKKILSVYAKAWTTRNPKLLQTIFEQDARYFEKYYSRRMYGLKEIEKYWTDRVANGEKNIRFKLQAYYVDGNTLIAEWEASFIDLRDKRKRKCIYEVAIMEISRNMKIKAHREFWDTK